MRQKRPRVVKRDLHVYLRLTRCQKPLTHMTRDLPKRPIDVKRDLQKRPIDVKRDLHLYQHLTRCQQPLIHTTRDLQKRPTTKNYKRDIVAHIFLSRQETYKRDLQKRTYRCQKRPTKETYRCQKRPTFVPTFDISFFHDKRPTKQT